jgi:AraC family transcriptional regulator
MAAGSDVRQIVVEAQARIGLGTVALVSERYTAPIDIAGTGRDHHLQLSMMPSSNKQIACYPEHWGPHRFERLGDLFLVPAQACLRARSECRAQRSIVCHLERDLVTQWFDADIKWTDQRLVGSLDITNGQVKRLMHRIAEELHSPGFASAAMIELIAAQACIELSRYFRALDIAVPRGGLAPWRSRLIEEHLAHDPGGATLAGLARLCGLSVRHLTRAFRVTYHRSLGDFIAEHRIGAAQQLLTRGGTVKEAAFAGGFSAPSNFAAAFRRATGHSPRAFRDRTCRKEEVPF